MSSNKVMEWINSITLGTLIILIINCSVEIINFITSAPLGYFAISANNFFNAEMYYTVLSSAFVHVNLMHIGFNMMSLLQLGPILESQFGTSQFLYMSIWTVFLCGFIYILLQYICFWVTGSSSWLGIGFILFYFILF
jgi:membrane associated rhomboid family serine protease